MRAERRACESEWISHRKMAYLWSIGITLLFVPKQTLIKAMSGEITRERFDNMLAELDGDALMAMLIDIHHSIPKTRALVCCRLCACA